VRRLLIVLACVLVAAPAWAGSKSRSEVNRHIESLVVRIEEAYRALENAQYRNSIAVFDLADDSPQAATRNLGMACSQLLTTRLSQTGRFYVVERVTLQKVIDEMRLGMTGLVDEATAAKAGRLVGADIIVVGSVSEVGEYFNVNIRLVEVETSHLLVSAMEEIPRDLLIESAGTFRPPSYRVGISVHTYNEKGDVHSLQEWLGFLYSRQLRGRFYADLEGGWAFGTNLEASAQVPAAPPEVGYTWYSLDIGEGPFMSARIHWALVNGKTLRITTHTGVSAFRVSYDRDAWAGQSETSTHASRTLLSAPFGLTLHLQPRMQFSYRLDFDYLTPLNELRVNYSGESGEPAGHLSKSISGPTASASLVMYF